MPSRKDIDRDIARLYELQALAERLEAMLGLEEGAIEVGRSKLSLTPEQIELLLAPWRGERAPLRPAELDPVQAEPAAPKPRLMDAAAYQTARRAWICECPGNGHRNCRHADCAQSIAPGDRYIEYGGESAGYRSGSRYCLACGIDMWAAGQWSAGQREARPIPDQLWALAERAPERCAQFEEIGAMGDATRYFRVTDAQGYSTLLPIPDDESRTADAGIASSEPPPRPARSE
jgi:hypothetical protein